MRFANDVLFGLKTRMTIATAFFAVCIISFGPVAQTDEPPTASTTATPPKRPQWEMDIDSLLEPISKRLPAVEAVREWEESTVALRAKYVRHPRAQMYLLEWERGRYDNQFNDPARAGAVGLEHRSLHAKVIMNQAIRHARTICDLGDAHRALGQTEKALAYYIQVHDFPLPKPPLCDHARLAEFDEIRTRATLAALAAVPADEAYSVRYVPEHLNRIEKEFPDKAPHLLRGHSWEEIADKVWWAKQIVSDATSPDADPKYELHCQALVEFIKRGGF